MILGDIAPLVLGTVQLADSTGEESEKLRKRLTAAAKWTAKEDPVFSIVLVVWILEMLERPVRKVFQMSSRQQGGGRYRVHKTGGKPLSNGFELIRRIRELQHSLWTSLVHTHTDDGSLAPWALAAEHWPQQRGSGEMNLLIATAVLSTLSEIYIRWEIDFQREPENLTVLETVPSDDSRPWIKHQTISSTGSNVTSNGCRNSGLRCC